MKSTKKPSREIRNVLTERSFLGLYCRITLSIVVLWMIAYACDQWQWHKQMKEKSLEPARKTVWKNLDPNRRMSEIQEYDYKNFTVTYYPEEEPRSYTPSKKASSYTVEPDLIDLNDVDPYDLIDYLDADLD